MAAITTAGRASGLAPLELGGDSRAAEALYEQHSSRVFGYCLSRLGRREDAEDAVQTTFLHAVRGLRRGVVPSMEVAWLLGIARNVCLSRREAAGRRSRLETPCDPLELDRGSEAPQGRREELIGLEDALSRLPVQQRRAVLLRDWRGLSYAEVAAELGVSHAAVETLIFRGRRTLAELLREEPAATRRRLASLGNAGSLFTYVKAAFTGAAAATKLAAAICIVAVSGAGLAVGSSIGGRGGDGAQSPGIGRSPTAATLASAAAVMHETRNQAAVAGPSPKAARRSASPAPTRVVPTSSPAAAPFAPTDGARSAAGPTVEPTASPTPATGVSAPPAQEIVPAVTTAVSETVGAIVGAVVPSLPVTPPALPDLGLAVPSPPSVPVAAPPADELAGSLPAATVAPPVTVDPPKLLP